MIGIYKIKNTIDGRCYIGQARSISTRWTRHRRDYKNDKHHLYNSKLYRAIRKHGIENFVFEIVAECSICELDELEVNYVSENDSFKNGYNQIGGGKSGGFNRLSHDTLTGIVLDLTNSTISSREIALKWGVTDRTITSINCGKSLFDESQTYPLRTRHISNRVCPDCGGEKLPNAVRCKNCNELHMRVVKDRPQKNELIRLISELGFRGVGLLFGVSDKAVVKWCRAYGLPTTKKALVGLINTPLHQLER